MATEYIVYGRRSSGTVRKIEEHSDDPNASSKTGSSPFTSPPLRPDEYLISVAERDTSTGEVSPRSAEIADTVLPEPWNEPLPNGISVTDLLNRTPWANVGITDKDGLGIIPNFLLDYENLPAVIPPALQSNHVRPSVATRWDSNGDLVENASGTLRLQRDPKDQSVLGLLYEPKRTQLSASPMDITSGDWNESGGVSSTTSNVGTSKGQSFDRMTEKSDTSIRVRIRETLTRQAEGSPFSISRIVKSDGRDWCYIECSVNDDDAATSSLPRGWFDLNNGVTGSTANLSDVTLIEHAIDDLGGGWYRINLSLKPDPSFALDSHRLGMSNADGVVIYDGNGSSLNVMHLQAEMSREVTTPILQGGGVREADSVDYRFSFPDTTTGVAYTIRQEAGDSYESVGHLRFGTTSDADDINHGVIMDGGGLNDLGVDGWKQVTRNSDDTDDAGDSPLDETIDRFQVAYGAGTQEVEPVRLVRQTVIFTQTLTSTQLSDLESKYLTQP